MINQADLYWKNFEKSGNIQDYLAYCALKNQTSNSQTREGSTANYATNNPSHCAETTQGGR